MSNPQTIGAFACSRPKFLEKFWSRTLGRGEELLLRSGWTLIAKTQACKCTLCVVVSTMCITVIHMIDTCCHVLLNARLTLYPKIDQ